MPAMRPADMLSLSARPEALAEALEVLGLPADATLEQATRHYRDLVRQAHPDLNRAGALRHAVATQRTAQINAAWQLVRPAAEALDAHRRRLARASRPVGTLNPAAARIISADLVRIDRPRVIPVPPPGQHGRRGAA